MNARTLGLALAAGLGLSLAAPAMAMHHNKLEAAFQAADKDGDGSLDKEEAKALPRVSKHFDRLDADRSGTLSLDEITAGAEKGRKTHDRMKQRHDHAKDRFAAADTDGDGSLDREEAKSLPHVARDFDRIDADQSGTVTVEELRAFMKHHSKDRRRDRGAGEERGRYRTSE